MAKVTEGGAGARLPSHKGVVYYSRWRGKIRVNAWPKAPKRKLSLDQQHAVTLMKEAAQAVKLMPTSQIEAAMEASHGTQALWRDLLFMSMYGRLPMLIVTDDGEFRPMAARGDVSDFLDALGPAEGAMVYRGKIWWEEIPAGNNGEILTWDGTNGLPKWLPGGGGYARPWWFSVPPANQFITLSGDSTNLIFADDPDTGLTVFGGNPASGTHVRTGVKPIADKNSIFTATIRIECLFSAVNYSGGGLVLRDSISGRLTSITMRQNGLLAVINFNNLASYASDVAGVQLPYDCNWLQVVHTGGAYQFNASPDGKIWQLIATVGNQTFLTNKADQYGVVIDYDRAGGIPNSMSVGHLSLVT